MSIDKETFASIANDHAGLWKCTPDGEISFTHSSLLWPVMRSGEKLILKVVDPHDDEAHAAELLKFYAGRGSVTLVESDANVQLLERIEGSGQQPLEQMVLNGQDDGATHIICDVIKQLHSSAVTGSHPASLIPFQKRSDDMRSHMREGRVKPEDQPMFQAAHELCNELILQTLETQIPLHGDIHHFNILWSDARGWLAIDPKGLMGPRIYEYANSLCNPYMHKYIVTNPTRMDRQASIISERGSFDKHLLLNFTFLHAMQCAAWSLFQPDQGYWLACAKTAGKLANVPLPDLTLGS